jgi:thymidine kinase
MTKDQVMQLAQVVDNLKLPVLTYGLRTDFRAEVFEGSQYLLSWAEELTEIKTICHCGSKATMNARIDKQGKIVREGEQIEIGGNDRYIALCRKHFVAGKVA